MSKVCRVRDSRLPPAQPARRLQHGQALVEALVVGLLLVPVVLASILLGKYQAAEQAVAEASRSLVFECTVRIDECVTATGFVKLAEEAALRHLSRADREIFSQDQVPDLARGTERHALLVNRRGDGLLEQFADLSLTLTPSRFDAGLGVVRGLESTGQFSAAVDLMSSLAGPARFGLDLHGGLLVGRISTTLGAGRSVSASGWRWLDGWPVTLSASTAILVDDWSASRPDGPDPRSVATRVEAGARLAAPLEAAQDLAYAPTRAAIALLGALGLENNAGSFRYHEIDMDIVPADRRGLVTPEAGSLPEIYSGW